ncbi:MAG TPA: hypothetical protein DD381_00930 [Lentisphaeria bacterium]|nr:MAG: hypothetical protein A2X47_00090 [Lentisphaerae bacterium GWF2_38_69]HBM14906.1 hypothetical protein [Lentisphaeria bacterium]
MIINKKQLYRLIRLASAIKQNKYPNCSSFAEEMKKCDMECSTKTVQRDFYLLKNYYNAPIEFDFAMNGYYLKHHGWEFNAPLYNESELLSSVLGAKIAEDIMPEPLKSQIKDSVDQILSANNPDFLDTATINTFIASSGVEVKIDPKVFGIIFSGWKNHNSVKIVYEALHGKESSRSIDPYVITYYNSAWYVKTYCHLRNDIRVFAIHRIRKASPENKTFEVPKEVLKGTIVGQPFNYQNVKDIELWCSNEIAGYIIERADANSQEYAYNDDGSINLIIKSAPKHTLTRWILSEGSNIKVLKPESLIKEIKSTLRKTLNIYKN